MSYFEGDGMTTEEKLKIAIDALRFYEKFTVSGKITGGVYNPKLGCFLHETISEWADANPARDALKKILGESCYRCSSPKPPESIL
jgi:hypothetical protein